MGESWWRWRGTGSKAGFGCWSSQLVARMQQLMAFCATIQVGHSSHHVSLFVHAYVYQTLSQAREMSYHAAGNYGPPPGSGGGGRGYGGPDRKRYRGDESHGGGYHGNHGGGGGRYRGDR